MLDYPLLAALDAVVREGSFERAALALHVTPSAVSQRIKLLEQRLGQRLVVRSQPCRATPAGLPLLRHAEQVAWLEAELAQQLPGSLAAGLAGAAELQRPTLRIAVNADSLATWFIPAAAAFASQHAALLDLRIDDQDHTAEALRQGEVEAAVTTLAAPVPGCLSLPLGRMDYAACASPAFVARHFGADVSARSLAEAPCLAFNTKDRLQEQWVHAVCGQPLALQRHWLPASQAFVDAAVAGLGWGMQPLVLVAPLLANGALVELPPQHRLGVALHWQQARASQAPLRPLADAVLAAARAGLDVANQQPVAAKSGAL